MKRIRWGFLVVFVMMFFLYGCKCKSDSEREQSKLELEDFFEKREWFYDNISIKYKLSSYKGKEILQDAEIKKRRINDFRVAYNLSDDWKFDYQDYSRGILSIGRGTILVTTTFKKGKDCIVREQVFYYSQDISKPVLIENIVYSYINGVTKINSYNKIKGVH